MLNKIDELENSANKDLQNISSADELENFRIKYLGSKGKIKSLMSLIKDVPKEHKKEFGQKANTLQKQLQEQFNLRKAKLGNSAAASQSNKQTIKPHIDITQPATAPKMGHQHIITQTIDELVEVFARMGFEVADGPEIEDELHNFVALNIPKEHPARDPLDNFYLTDSQADNPSLMRSQTSTVQIRVMENSPPPIRIISTGRVYRPDEHDATHHSMFHQVEGLYVDKKVSFVDLKTTLYQFAQAYWGKSAEVKLVPSYFPFTEPSAELYVKFEIDGKQEWIEVGGCGMVDPAVFEAVGYDPQEYSGFAFGLGIERLAMRKYNITDIRQFFENDVRFLQRF